MKGKERKEDRNRIMMGFLAIVMVLLGIAVYFMSGIPPTADEIILNAVVVVVVVLAFILIRNRFRSYKAGLPAEDEMSKKHMQKAGYYSWLFAIYAALVSRYAGEVVAERTGDWSLVGTYMTIGVVLGSALFFFVMYFWFRRRGE